MSKPTNEVENKEYYKDVRFLYEIINSFKNIEELKTFLKDILTSSELRMLKRRWHVAILLAEGLDIRNVAFESKTSTQTVSKIKGIIEEGFGGLALAIKRAKEEGVQDKNYGSRSRGGSKYAKNLFKDF